ncbi:MAG TPA: 2OG-Fe(II) oxygenase family protein [Dongiaceae bacterium]|nr:2OG-Fe(II) oxygenase family protein [Dongiaceae bacterium]
MSETGNAIKTDDMQDAKDLSDIVDLGLYPIDTRDNAAYCALVAGSRDRLRREGAAIFPGFVKDAAVRSMATEAVALQSKMFRFHEEHTVYFKPQEAEREASHPLRRMMVTEKDTAAYADIPQGSLVRGLYQSDAVLHFINDVLDDGQLYRHADPLAALNIQNFAHGQQLGWHFDRSDFSVTLSIQAPEAGGDFEYVRMLRKEGDECYDSVGRFLDDPTTQDILVLPQVPGTLTMFRGRYSLHRVAPVIGDRLRINAVLAYVNEPGVVFNDYARRLFYGRATA